MKTKSLIPRFLPFRYAVFRFERVKPAIQNEIRCRAEAAGIDVTNDGLGGRRGKGPFPDVLEWSIRPGDNAYIVEERLALSRRWYALFFLTLLSGVLTVGGFVPVSMPTLIGAVVLFFGVFVALLRAALRPLPITHMGRGREQMRGGLSVFFILPLLIILVVGFGLLSLRIFEGGGVPGPRLDYPGLGFSLPLWVRFSMVVIVNALLFVTVVMSNRFQIDDYFLMVTSRVGAPIITGYQKTVMASILPALVAILVSDMIWFGPMVKFLQILVIALATVLAWNFYREVSSEVDETYYSIVQNRAGIEKNRIRILIAATSLLFGLATIGVIIVFFLEYHRHFLEGNLLLRIFIFVVVLPLFYVPTGILLQLGTSVSGTVSLFRYSRPAPELRSDKARVRTLAMDSLVAGSYSIGPRSYIFVSDGLLEMFNEEQRRAVIAHEEGHIINNDALLSFAGPFVAAFMFVGENVVYSFLDFQRREFQADRYAARRVGSAPLIEALEKFSQRKVEETTLFIGASPSFTPISTGAKRQWRRYFVTLFGDYALTQIHPSIYDRIATLRENP